MKKSVSKIALTVYVVLFLLSGFFMATAGGRVVPFCMLAIIAIFPVAAGPRRYRVMGAIALVTAILLMAMDYYAGKSMWEKLERIENRQIQDAPANNK